MEHKVEKINSWIQAIKIISLATALFVAGFGFSPATAAADDSEPAVFAVTRAGELVEGAYKALYGGECNFSGQAPAPDQVAPQLLPLLNAATFDEDEYDPEAAEIRRKIKYVKDKPTSPWQIVLIPSGADNGIRVEGYGEDVSTPLYVHLIKF